MRIGGIIIEYLTKAQLYAKVGVCRKILKNAGLSAPFFIEDICRLCPEILIEYIPFKTNGLRGIVTLATEAEPTNCILINSRLTKEEQHFHSIHEFMHIILHPNMDSKTFKCFDTIRPNQNGSIEWQANEGAAELIMPYKQFIPLFLEMYNEYANYPDRWNLLYGRGDIAYALGNYYGVSGSVIKNRISGLSYEIDQVRFGHSTIDNIKILSNRKQKACGIISTDYLTEMRKISVSKYYFNEPLEWNSVIA